MKCCKSIEMPLLTEHEAHTLFKLSADKINNFPKEFDKVGMQIAKECKGLPIAIVVVGATLKTKGIEEWKWSLRKLKQSQRLDLDEDLRDPYKCLELSYENLQPSIAKSLFLLCSMFPKDHEIHKEDLVRFSKGAIEQVMKTTMNDARVEVLRAINTLVDCYLLMPTNNQTYVKMHGLARDVALLIVQKQHEEVLVAHDEVPTMLHESESVRDKKVISLWNLKKKFEASYQLHCLKLEVLLLHSEEFIIVNFKGIEALKVLAFVQFCFDWILPRVRIKWSVPQSILSLKNLNILCLRGIALGDISFLDKLEGLEILDLRGSSFDKLPFAVLKKLKLLDLFGCSIEQSPYEAIGNYMQLEELHLWIKKHVIPETFPVSRLQRYVICDTMWDFGTLVPLTSVDISWRHSFLQYFAGNVGELRALCVQGRKVLYNSPMIDLIHTAEFLYLENCWWDSYKEKRYSEIKCLVLVRCPVKSLIFDNPQGQEVFPLLTTLRLADMDNLEQVFKHSSIKKYSLEAVQELNIHRCPVLYDICFPQSSNLSCLRELQLVYCPMLESPIFTTSIARSLVALEKLYLMNCNNLEHVIAEDEEECGNSNNPGAFQNLRTLEVDSCENLESILPLYFARNIVRLGSLSVQSTPKLNYMFGRKKGDIVLGLQRNKNKNPMEIEIKSMPSLTNVSFGKLPALISLFPHQYASPTKKGKENDKVWMVITATANQPQDQVLPQSLQVFLNLETLSIKSCMRNKGIFEFLVEGVGGGKEKKPFKLDSTLSCIEVTNLPDLEFIWKGPAQSLSLHRLERVLLRNCPRLRTIFTLVSIANLLELRQLYVMNCDEWEGIFSKDSLKTLSSPSCNVCFPKLSEITIQNCNKVKWAFSYSLACHCPSLEALRILDCSKLEGVIYGFKGVASVNQPLFPELKSQSSLLNLLNLPKLREIFPGYVHQSHHAIKDCPNLLDTFPWYHE